MITITYRQLLQNGISLLRQAGIPEPDLDAWYLFSECFHMTRAEYLMKQSEFVKEEQAGQENRWQTLMKRRLKREPLQYILGTQEFMGFSFFVTPDVLIPRQDTEILVEKALSVLEKGDTLLDMCTGSGCILLSLAKMKKLKRAVGADISEQALMIAKKNADALNVQAEFCQSDLFEHIDRTEKFSMIVSNPPYVTGAEMKELLPEVADYEPHTALFGGEDGLEFYRQIITACGEFLEPEGRLLLEIGCRQAEDVKNMMQKNGYQEIEIVQDLAGLDRVVAGVFVGQTAGEEK